MTYTQKPHRNLAGSGSGDAVRSASGQTHALPRGASNPELAPGATTLGSLQTALARAPAVSNLAQLAHHANQGQRAGQLAQLRAQLQVQARATNRQATLPPVQRWREMSSLRKVGWKYSGGNIATNSNVDPLWHATVFGVNTRGQSEGEPLLFFNGFHLTMEYKAKEDKVQPHVFFDAQGNYDQAKTTSHPQTRRYIQEVSDGQWQFDLTTAQDLSKGITATLGPILEEQERKRIEDEWVVEKQRKKDQEELDAIEAAKKEKERLEAAALARDEETSIAELLKDVRFGFGPYPKQFEAYVAGDKAAVKDGKLKQVADWYLYMRDTMLWIVDETPQAAYTNWGRTPVKVVWKDYPNSLTRTWRAKNPQTTFMMEYRSLKFSGYASYKMHPKALQPPKV
jgi:hypothetical protein